MTKKKIVGSELPTKVDIYTSGWSKDEDHLVRITELVGDLPGSIIRAGCYGSKYYEGRRLKNVDQGTIKAYTLFQVRKVHYM